MSALPIFLTVDVGPDGASVGAGHTRRPTWEATYTGLGVLMQAIGELEDELGMEIPMTFYIRADSLVRSQFGSSSRIYDTTRRLLGDAASIHELGWMPQVIVEDQGCVQYEDLNRTYAELNSIGWSIESMRMGDHFHDSTTMQIIDELGVKIDCTALPGRLKHDEGWKLDWLSTPSTAYHPSVLDYRRPGDVSRNVLEIPLTLTRIKAPYDTFPLARYVNPCFRHDILWQDLELLLQRRAYLVLIAHPDELVGGQKHAHPLVAYDSGTFKNNLGEIFRSAERLGRTCEFCKICTFSAVDGSLKERV